MKILKSLILGLIVAFTFLLAPSQGQTGPLDWSADGKKFWFASSQDRAKQFFVVDVSKRKKSLAFDHEKVAKALSEQLDRNIEASNLPIDQLAFGEANVNLILQSGSKYFLLDQKSSELKAVEKPKQFKSQSRFFLPARSGRQGTSTNIVIENKTDKPFELFWYSSRRRVVSYGTIEPNNKLEQQTFAGHVWLIKVGRETRACFEARENDYVTIDEKTFENVSLEKSAKRRTRRSPFRFSTIYTESKSPDRKWNATIKDYDLWLLANKAKRNSELKAEDVRLTTNGSESRTFQDIGAGTRWRDAPADRSEADVRWSPNSKYVLAFQTARIVQPVVHYVESKPRNKLQPTLKNYNYPKPGDKLQIRKLRLFKPEDQREIEISDELFKNPFWLRFLGWSESGDSFRLLYNERGHKIMRLLEVAAETGEVKTIIEEKSDTFIQYSDQGKSVFEDLPDDAILWASERSGWNHLYRFDKKSGNLINAVTKGDWNVKRIQEINRETKSILFYAVGVYEDQDPYHEHLCSVNFDGSEFRILTEGDGTHQIEFVKDAKYFFDTYSRVDMAPIKEIRETKTGELIAELSRQSASKLFRNRKPTERFVAKGRDGKTDIWGIIHWPRNFDADKKYPVVENIYAGPHDHHVPKSFRTRYRQHSIADAGMIVVQIDGMGTAWRSKTFHDVCHKNLRDAGFPDRIAWMKAAAKKFPQLDLSRVGIYGGSAGGQNAMAALLWHNDFYKVAVADCGCHDNRMDKIWWNEQWMGWPVDESYAKNSNMENAHLLKGQLMLTLGELDQNVDPASTAQVIHQLIKHDKDFEFVLVAGQGHGAGESPWAAKKRLNFLKRHLGIE